MVLVSPSDEMSYQCPCGIGVPTRRNECHCGIGGQTTEPSFLFLPHVSCPGKPGLVLGKP